MPAPRLPLRATRTVQLLLLTAVTASAYYSRTTLGPLQETMRAALGLSDNQMALLQGPPLALGVIAAIPLGLWIDRHSRTRLMRFLAALIVVATLLMAWESRFLGLFVARCLIGVSVAASWVAVLSLLADSYTAAQRGRATTVVAIGGVAGMSAAFALGGVLLAMCRSGPDSWHWAMLGLSVPLIVGTVLTLGIREPARSGQSIQNPAAKEIYRQLWRHRARLLPLTAGFTLVGGVADGAAVVWAAPTLSRSFGMTPERVGSVMAAILLIIGILGPILGGALADLGQRTGGPPRTVSALTVVLFVSIPTALFAIAPGVGSACMLLTLFLILGSSFQVAVQTLITVIIPSELRGACLALMLAISLIFAFGVAPMLVSELSSLIGGAAMIGQALAAVCVGSSVIGAVMLLLGRQHFSDGAVRERMRR